MCVWKGGGGAVVGCEKDYKEKVETSADLMNIE